MYDRQETALMNDSNKLRITKSYRLPQALSDKIDQTAKHLALSHSDFVRLALTEAINKSQLP